MIDVHQSAVFFSLSAKNKAKNILIFKGEKPYVCQVCQKQFSDRSNLLKHEPIHFEDRQFECVICNKKFAQKRSLQLHLKTH